MGTLTVRENIMFSANLRLPQTMSDEEKRDRVDEAIEDLGLAKCADTKVGIIWRIETYISRLMSCAVLQDNFNSPVSLKIMIRLRSFGNLLQTPDVAILCSLLHRSCFQQKLLKTVNVERRLYLQHLTVTDADREGNFIADCQSQYCLELDWYNF